MRLKESKIHTSGLSEVLTPQTTLSPEMHKASGVNGDIPVYVCNEFSCRTFPTELWFTALKLNLALLKKIVLLFHVIL